MNSAREIADRLKETAEYLVELASAQMRLARLELLGDVRAAGARLTRLLLFLPLLLLGYALLAAALVAALAPALGLTRAFALVGVSQLAIGAVGAARALRNVRR